MLKKIFFLLSFLICLGLLSAVPIRYLQETFDFLELEISLKDLNISDAGEFTEIDLIYAAQSWDSDSPDIPFIKLFFAVPENGSLQAQVQEFGRKTISIEKPVQPVSRQNAENPLLSDYHIDQHKYSQTLNLLEIQSKETFNQYDIIPVVINPISYNHLQKRLSFPETIILSVNISGDFPRNIPEYTDFSRNIYSDLIVNRKYGLNFQQTRSKNFNTSNFYRSHSWYRIEIMNTGMHVLDYQFLNSLPLVDIDPRTIRIFSTGGAMMSSNISYEGWEFKEIPLHVITSVEGSFSQQDRIIFYAEERDGFGKNLPNARFDFNYSYETRDGRSQYVLNIGDFVYYNPYSKAGVYWLTWGGNFDTPPVRMQVLNNQNYSTTRSSGRVNSHHQAPNVKKEQYGYLWFTQIFTNRGNTPSNFQFSVNIEDLDTSFPQTFDFVGSADRNTTSSQPHRLSVAVNNTNIINRNYWLEHNTYRLSPYTSNFLVEGRNNIVFTTQGNTISQYLMFFNIEWYKKLIKRNSTFAFKAHPDDENSNILYEFENPHNQTLSVYQINAFNEANILNINSNSFIASSSSETKFYITAINELLRPSSITHAQITHLDSNPPAHDVMIVYPLEFLEGAQRLYQIYDQIYGYMVHMVSLESVFDNFNGGHPDPVALRNYLQFLQFNAPGDRPKGAVFLGSGTIDNRNFSGIADTKNKFLVNQLDHEGGNSYNMVTTSDDFYGMLTPRATPSVNSWPEIIIGRIPAKNNQELNNYLDKLEEYLDNRNAGWWQFTFQIVADDEHYGTGTSDFSHTRQSEEISDSIERNIMVDKLYAIEYELDAFKRKPHVRDILVDRINEGRLYWLFIGHGSIRNLGDERYFTADSDISLLNNRGKYPIFIAASCDVGQYELPGITSLAEDILLLRNAGSIVSICATGKSYGGSNFSLFSSYLNFAINENRSPGQALMNAKPMGGMRRSNIFYNVLGDPFLKVSYPTISHNFEFTPSADSLLIRQTVHGQGHFENSIQNNVAHSLVFDNGRNFILTTLDGRNIGPAPSWNEPPSPFPVTRTNLPIFNGPSSLNNSSFNLGFIVPDAINSGNNGKIYTMAVDRNTNQTYINIKNDVSFSHETLPILPDTKPQIEIFLDSFDFKDGDTVSANPTLYATIYSEHGIITSLGYHGIMVYFEGSREPINVSSGFEYDLDSFTSGRLTWQLNGLEPGRHDLYLTVSDSFREKTHVKTSFSTSSSTNLSIENVLAYPNPMRDGGYFTFVLSDDANVTISIYTITGRRIYNKRFDDLRGRNQYHQIPWDGRDADGHRIANGTYFYTIRATPREGRGSKEITERLMILR